MENLKIEVNSEAESKEVQELFVVLGHMVVNNIDCEKGYIVASKNAESPINFDYWYDVKNIITIQQLRDMVVLKRNDVGDATHKGSITDNVYYVSIDEEVYRFESSAWCFSTVIVADLKPIEKPMKEYLNKLTDGTYKLVVLSDVIDGHDGLIEIPEGADVATSAEAIYFWNTKNNTTYVDGEGWVKSSDGGMLSLDGYLTETDYKIIWQRHTQPEELPFVDDFPDFSFESNVEQAKHNHYFIDVSDVDEVDFYEIALRYNVTDPCIQHILKKCLAVGNRGHKDFHTDLKDIYDTAARALRIHGG